MSEELHNGRRLDRLELDVGELKTDFATVKSDLRGFASILGEIKQGLQSSRPPLYAIIPVALTLVAMIAAGVAAVMTIGAQTANLKTEADHLQDMQRLQEARLWDLNTRLSRQEGKKNGQSSTPGL